jgi:CubicO group peptidase (beta-lactamase class C family)
MNKYKLDAKAIDKAIALALEQKRLVGAVVLVALGGEQVYRRAAGMADREAGKPMRIDALFRLASVSKPILSTAALVLMAQGRLRLEDPVARWLPSFRPRTPDGQQPLVNVRHLMTHTAGLSYRFFQPEHGSYAQAGVSDGMDDDPLSLAENVRRIASAPLQAAPGTEWRYSIATDVLGAVIEQASGLPLAQAVAHLVTGPMAMRDTGFSTHDAQRLTVAYANHYPEPRPLQQPDRIEFIDGTAGFKLSPARALDASAYASGGAGMVGSAEDFLRLLETLRRGGAPLLPEEWVTGHDQQPDRRFADAILAGARFWAGDHRIERSAGGPDAGIGRYLAYGRDVRPFLVCRSGPAAQRSGFYQYRAGRDGGSICR